MAPISLTWFQLSWRRSLLGFQMNGSQSCNTENHYRLDFDTYVIAESVSLLRHHVSADHSPLLHAGYIKAHGEWPI
jgi:hypothetical protein